MTESTEAKLEKIVAYKLKLSRRAAEKLIQSEGVMVDGKLIRQPQQLVDPSSQLKISGRSHNALLQKHPCQVLLYHKRVGEICAHGPAQPSIFASLPQPETNLSRWIMVGRLDINSSGLILFTTHGELANRLMHPKYSLDREYAVRVNGKVTHAMIARLKKGVKLEDGIARFNDIVIHNPKRGSANQWFYVVVQSGRYRMVRRLWQAQGLQVSRLMRVRYANLLLPPSLRPGDYILLDKKTRESLMSCVDYRPV